MIPILIALAFSAVAAPARAASYFVAPSGSDAGPGTRARPFASLGRAQTAARAARTGGAVTVFLRGGIYYLGKPLVFTPSDSGTAKAPIVYRAYHDEKPILSGAVPLHLTWTPYKNGIMQAKLPAGNEALIPDQLFVNGALQHMARYPNYDPTAQHFNGVSSDAVSPQRVRTWANPAGGYVHALHASHWGSLHYNILDSNPGGTLKMEGGWQNNRPQDYDHENVFVENVFEELDAPGEWYLDKTKGILYLMPEAGVELSTARVEGVVLKSLVEFQGSRSAPVRFISLRGLTLTQTARTFMLTKEPLLRSDWRIFRGGAAFLQGTEDCAIGDCDFISVGGNAVFVSEYNRRAIVSGCKVAEAGASGICFVGDPAAVRNPLFDYGSSVHDDQMDTTPGPKTNNYPAECTASDNLITHTGRIEKQSAGVEIDMAQDIMVSHCSIYDMPRAGINIGDGCWGGHVIEYCDVFDTVKESGDHGSFNSWGRDRYWVPERDVMDRRMAAHPDWFKLDVVKPNTLRDTRWVCRHGWDIDLDDGSTNYVIVNNVCLGGGIKNREGAYRNNENNVIPTNSFHPHVWFHDSHDVFAHNIVGEGYHPAGDFQPWWGQELDYNLFTKAGDLQAVQAGGHDAHSVAGDPQFVNPAIGDYRVKDGSPALEVGFKNFPMDRFGVVSPRLRAQARDGFDFANAKPEIGSGPKRDEALHDWLGARVKSVTSLGEQSIAGLPAIKGVILSGIPMGSVAAKIGFRSLDVIWTLDGKPVPDYAALLQRASAHPASEPAVTVQVYRNQKLTVLSVPAMLLALPVRVQAR